MKKNFFLTTITAAIISSSAFALQVDGSVSSSAVITNQKFSLQNAAPLKEVFLMKLKLSATEQQKIQNYKPQLSLLNNDEDALPKQIDVGMNKVPVLDQGRHGTCVTFANTAAIDAMLQKGDYVSQLCSLELRSYLADRGYFESGWDGSLGMNILNHLLQFGIVSKDNQTNKSCGGVTEYPLRDKDNKGNPMALDEYRSMSENLTQSGFYVQPIIDFYQRTDKNYDGNKLLTQVKKELVSEANTANAPSRMTFGTLIPVAYCRVGACGSYHQNNDTWTLTKSMDRDPSPQFGGHEMVITAYDDNAIVVDNEGVKHKGLFTLRNSWGKEVGDQGNYYMSYDFFKKYVLEVQAIKIEKQ